MKKHIFLVFASEGPQAQRICDDIGDIPGAAVEVVSTAQEASAKLKGGSISCLVFITNQFDSNSVKFLNLLRETRKNLSVMVFTNSVAKDIYTFTNTTKLRRVVIMENPYKKGDLTVVCEKIINGQEVYQRTHGRFNIEQTVNIDRLPTSEKATGVIKNMSLGGAYLEVEGRLEETDTVKITIPLSPNQSEAIYGEVIRVEVDAFGKGISGVGVRFITQESLYKALLSKLQR